MRKHIYTVWFLSLMIIACSSDTTIDENNVDNGNITLSFQINNFIKGALKSAVNDTYPDDQNIENLYIFLFPTTDKQTLKSYYISTPAFTGGLWNSVNNKVLLNLTQTEAGYREVYIVANCSSDLKNLLDGVTTITELQSVSQSSYTPWTPALTTPILMSGNAKHNFSYNYQLNNMSLTRALAKVQLNIKLSRSHQELPISSENITQYKYKLINFNKSSYVLEPTSKINDLASFSTWTNWNDHITAYTLDDTGKVTNLILTTYLNESENAKTAIELSLPYIDGGSLPPPEFGDETYKLQLPIKIERNHWYVYDIEI